MTKVLALVTYRVYPTLMGGQKGIALFYKYLQQQMPVLLLLARNNEIQKTQNNIALTLFANKTIYLNLFLIKRLKKRVQQYKPDVIVAEHSYAGWLALLLRNATGIPYIIHSHNLEALRFKQMNRRWWPLYWRYERWIHQQADFNFFISRADELYALENFKLNAAKCTTITYGVEPDVQQQPFDKNAFLKSIGIWEFEKVLYFNGTLDYKPNLDAVTVLLHIIIPILQKTIPNFKIVITGNRAAVRLKETLMQHPQVVFQEYVPDVKPYYQAAQLFLNPILQASGVKTKLVEALGNHCTVISTEAGASGIDKKVCGDKLVTVADNDWNAFTAKVVQELNKPQQQTGTAFFDTYSWNNITAKAAQKIRAVAQHYGK